MTNAAVREARRGDSAEYFMMHCTPVPGEREVALAKEEEGKVSHSEAMTPSHHTVAETLSEMKQKYQLW